MDHDDDVYSLLTITSQFYIVTGGNDGSRDLDSTEIMNKDGGTSWHTVASMPSISYALSGVSLPNGHFMISGENSPIHCGLGISLFGKSKNFFTNIQSRA